MRSLLFAAAFGLLLLPTTAEAAEFILPFQIHCVPEHEPLGHCQGGNGSVAANVKIHFARETTVGQLAPAAGPVTLWTQKEVELRFTFTQEDLNGVQLSYDYSVEVQDTAGIDTSEAVNTSFSLQGNASRVVTFALATPAEWYEGDRIFVPTVLTHAGGQEVMWTQFVFDDPSTRNRMPLGPAVAVLALAAAALLVARGRR